MTEGIEDAGLADKRPSEATLRMAKILGCEWRASSSGAWVRRTAALRQGGTDAK